MRVAGRILFLFLFFNHIVVAQQKNEKLKSDPAYAQYVDPFIGTDGNGHTYPGATLPFGMVQLSPDTRIDGSWEGCSGYHYSDSIIYGFSHTHLSGTGCSDYGDISLMPSIKKPTYDATSYSAIFSHKNESALAGYYQVKLNSNIKVELTAGKRFGMHRYTFPKGAVQTIVLDLEHRDKALDYYIRVVNDSTIEGYRISEAWAKKQELFFYIVFDKPFSSKEWLLHDSITPTKIVKNGKFNEGHLGKIAFNFFIPGGGQVLAKVAISSVSAAGARNNMLQENTGWDFNAVKNAAFKAWSNELAKIEVLAAPKDQKKIFYTALYHTMLQPNIYNDADGKYKGRDGEIHTARGFDYYSVFSLWDTFRAWHPLMSIIDRKRTLDFIKTFLAQYEQGGMLPVWELSCNETECMIGYHSASVIADAVSKGIVDFDVNLALEAMKKSAESKQRYGLGAYMQNGCLSVEDESESVSKTLEYAYDDWCIAQVAKYLKKDGDYSQYMARSQSWKNLFDADAKFIKPKKNGDFISPFDPSEVNNNYTEANAWQYTFFVPQDLPGMIKAYGGAKEFELKLDSLFTVSPKTSGRKQADITGLIGQYAHGNEPSHHVAYLYHTIGKPYKTADKVHQILNDFYTAQPNGLIGNEDCGQMSAWYVLSAIGMYQICPGNPVFELSTPLFKQIIINLENNKKLFILSADKAGNGKYIKSINKPYTDSNLQINYSQIERGGMLNYKLTSNKDSALQNYTRNYEEISLKDQILINPIIKTTSNPFIADATISLNAAPGLTIFYTTDGSYPTLDSKLYEGPFKVVESTTIKAFATGNGKASKTSVASMHKLPHPSWKIALNCSYNPQYTAGGPNGIIDGLFGQTDWKKGSWQGYQNQDFEVVIDMGEEQEISTISANFLQDSRSWILFPNKVAFSYSLNNKDFIPLAEIKNTINANDYTNQIKSFSKEIKSTKARFIKVNAQNYGKLPAWHQGAGGSAFVFIDEITIK